MGDIFGGLLKLQIIFGGVEIPNIFFGGVGGVNGRCWTPSLHMKKK